MERTPIRFHIGSRKGSFEEGIFALAVTTVKGMVKEVSNVPSFVSDDREFCIPLPFTVGPDSIGKQINADIRNYDKQLLLEYDEDDRNVEDATEEDYLISSIDDINKLKDWLDTAKERVINLVVSYGGILCGSILGIFIFTKMFNRPVFRGIMIGFMVFSIINIILEIVKLGTSKVVDRAGNWIDLNQGTTSLNGGDFEWQSTYIASEIDENSESSDKGALMGDL